MPTSTGQIDTELRARRHAVESALEKVGMTGESARCRAFLGQRRGDGFLKGEINLTAVAVS